MSLGPTDRSLEVLFLEDNPSDAFLIESLLEEIPVPRVSLRRVDRLAEAMGRLGEESFDAALLDLNVPDSRGIETVERLRKGAPELPLVVLTGERDDRLVPQILAKGAQDYVLKQEAAGPLLAKSLLYAIERHRVAVEAERRARELLQSQAKIRHQAALIDAARDAILVLELSGRISFWNQGAERIHGWSAEEAVGQNALDFLHRDADRSREAFARVLETGEWMGEMLKATRSGRDVLTETRLSVIRDDSGAPSAVLSISTDITERKKLEARFLRAQRMESIGNLAGGIAHDLNNVLAPIMMAVGLLRERVQDPEASGLLEAVADSARRGAEMVRQVLTFARGVEGNRVALHPGRLLAEMTRIFNDTFFKSIQVRTIVAPDVHFVLGDRTQLQQVFMNLGVNARDAMPQGGQLLLTAANITLHEHDAIAPESRPGEYVVFSVSDNGTGIPPDILDKIFDPFFSTKDVGKGTGLGLATVQGIVKSHGGFVTVYSEPGRGTTFKVFLPAQVTGAPETAQDVALLLPRGNSELILVVDDEAAIREITKYTLESYGYRALVAANGSDALEIFNQHSAEIAVILTDMMMPQVDGVSTIRALKARNPALKAIAASGLGNDSQAAAAAAAGCDAFLPKPYSVPAVLKTLQDLLHPKNG